MLWVIFILVYGCFRSKIYMFCKKKKSSFSCFELPVVRAIFKTVVLYRTKLVGTKMHERVGMRDFLSINLILKKIKIMILRRRATPPTLQYLHRTWSLLSHLPFPNTITAIYFKKWPLKREEEIAGARWWVTGLLE